MISTTTYLSISGQNETDQKFFEKKYGNIGIKSRLQWYSYNLHKQKGATNKQAVSIDKHVRSTKGQGGSTDMSNKSNRKGNKNKKYIPQPFPLEDIFDFNYKDMIECEPDTNFNKVMNLVFNHVYDDIEKNIEQEKWIKRYNRLKRNGKLAIINDIYQRFSTYIKQNHLSRKWVDGSIICNVAIMTGEYIRTGKYKYNYDFLNNITKYNENDNFRFHLWLIRQCFVSKNRFYHKYIAGQPDVNWWAICKLQHRYSDKDMKTKAHCCGFKNNNGKYIYRKY